MTRIFICLIISSLAATAAVETATGLDRSRSSLVGAASGVTRDPREAVRPVAVIADDPPAPSLVRIVRAGCPR